MENMQDWCISRQLWWGHRCPAWLLTIEGAGEPDVSLPSAGLIAILTCQTSDDKNWIVARSAEAADAEAQKRAGGKKYTLKQDDDVLDTWFSSGLWPFAIMGWPEKVSHLHRFRSANIADEMTDKRSRNVLPQHSPRNGLGYHILLGSQDGFLR